MTTTQTPPREIRFADGSRVERYRGWWLACRRNETLASRTLSGHYSSPELAVAALVALGEGPAGEMRMREA